MKLKMTNNVDSRHRVQTTSPLYSKDNVWLPNENTEASVIEKNGPRAYSIATPKRTLQRTEDRLEQSHTKMRKIRWAPVHRKL